jgi:death-on-curing protein
MHYISADDIVDIHDIIIEQIGGKPGVREPGMLVSISNKPKTSFNGQELYPDIFLKASCLYEALCNYHVFIDGNKRTALIVLYRFLYINGYTLIASNKDASTYTISVAKNKPEIITIAHWIKANSKRI